ncbi:MAG: CxxxxCH/CxxCH domain-containing protein, partial [Polyangiaceae bacterium]|nr:CxxxxCH/CxxCH domain-containing protein [Polyangiaceae bacterium]
MFPGRHAVSIAWVTLIASLYGALSCSTPREETRAVSFVGEIAPLFAKRCDACHSIAGANGFSTKSYESAIACVEDGRPAVLPASGLAPLLAALETPRHKDVLNGDERITLQRWVEQGADRAASQIHPRGYANPRSEKRHGAALRGTRWAPMLDATRTDACGQCHDGTPSGRPSSVTSAAQGAPACTTCHTKPEGVLACTTCHGSGDNPAAPRDPCFFPKADNVHDAHVLASPSRQAGIACASCHPGVAGLPGMGAHGNGSVDVVFDPKTTGASFWDASSGTCVTACHARGGASPSPTWKKPEQAQTCGSCHGSPPARHYAGACTACHKEANGAGTSLVTPTLHINGRVDLGDGSGKCGACHGQQENPLPNTGAHLAHASPKGSAPVACDTCHVVPSPESVGHPRGGAPTVSFAPRAVATNPATYNQGTCANVACHGAGLIGTTARTPSWNDSSGKESACGSCHTNPPGAPHPTSTDCAGCHSGVAVNGPSG